MSTYRLLGALEVVRAGRPVDLGGPKQRAVLAALLLDARQIVSADRLIHAVWGDDPTTSASGTLQVYISNLRRALRDGDVTVSPIVRRSPGYLIEVDPEVVDTSRFVSLTDQTQHGVDGQEWRSAVWTARQALGLWRGPLLARVAEAGARSACFVVMRPRSRPLTRRSTCGEARCSPTSPTSHGFAPRGSITSSGASPASRTS